MDGFVLGTTMLFGKSRPYGEVIQEIRSMGKPGDIEEAAVGKLPPLASIDH